MLQLISLVCIVSKRTVFEAYQRVSLNYYKRSKVKIEILTYDSGYSPGGSRIHQTEILPSVLALMSMHVIVDLALFHI